jgi:hypothetical protein
MKQSIFPLGYGHPRPRFTAREKEMVGIDGIRYCVRKIYAFSVDFASYSSLCRNYSKEFLPTKSA